MDPNDLSCVSCVSQRKQMGFTVIKHFMYFTQAVSYRTQGHQKYEITYVFNLFIDQKQIKTAVYFSFFTVYFDNTLDIS